MTLKPIFKVAATASALTLPQMAMAAAPALTVAGVSFAAPWVLLGLGALPALWWLMKSVPPKANEVLFPAVRLLFNLQSEDQKPAQMPLWQRLLRTAAAAAVVIGLAQPHFNPNEALQGDGSVMLVVDNGWASARNWPARMAEMNVLVDRAERDNRPVIILPTAPSENGEAVKLNGPMNAAEARGVLHDLKPEPWPTDRAAAMKAAEATDDKGTASVVWLSDGLDDPAAKDMAKQLQTYGKVTVLEDEVRDRPQLLLPPQGGEETLTVGIRRSETEKEDSVILSASDEAGHVLKQVEAHFKAGESETKASFDVPDEIRNQLARVSIDGNNSVAGVVLLDERWRRRPVGVAGGAGTEGSLLDESNYIDRALNPYVDLHKGSVDELLKQKLAVLILPDEATMSDATQKDVMKWVQDGGTVLRFAGPRLAAGQGAGDDLVAVKLRPGSRALGGAFSESKPGKVAPFEEKSPFYGIKLPDNVTVEREVTAQPGPELDQHVWARLDDGSPLVTARTEGKGKIVLVHTTANREWSNLVLSGLFIEMMRAVVAQSQGVAGGPEGNVDLPPIKVFDGLGQLMTPSSAVRPLTREAIDNAQMGPHNPPGLYGNESMRQAYNLASAVPEIKPLTNLPDGVTVRAYDANRGQRDLGGALLGGAMGLMLIDLLVLLSQRGALPRIRKDQQNRPSGGVQRMEP